MAKLRRRKIEFGDFQTPEVLASAVCDVLASRGVRPATIVEPTCGTGTFLLQAVRHFPLATGAIGLEVNAAYFGQLTQRVAAAALSPTLELRHADFFACDWREVFRGVPQPILVVGNPPWVTAATLGSLDSENVPHKSNFQGLRGMEAKTGKSNFDIAEWMLIELVESLAGREAWIAVLLKASVARRLLTHLWKQRAPITQAQFLRFDCQRFFAAAVDAGALIFKTDPGTAPEQQCQVMDLEHPARLEHTIALRDGELTPDVEAFERTAHLAAIPGTIPPYRWRSGVKHDCAKVLELTCIGGRLINRHGETVDVEDSRLFPLMKGSDLARGPGARVPRFIVIPQSATGDDTALLARTAPRTWAYLNTHREAFVARRSSIYRRRPDFAIFGIGPYTFAPWKVAMPALYKRIYFQVIGPLDGRPILVDDTVYHLSCTSCEEATLLMELFNSPQAREFLQARVFWDAMRPLTIGLLDRLDVFKLAIACGREGDLKRVVSPSSPPATLAAPGLFAR